MKIIEKSYKIYFFNIIFMNTKRQENVEYTPEDCLGLIEEIVDILKDDSFSPN
jgi:hypothetical protein